ncbi:MAG TPA: cytochrome ubiquinol oxidase subunit I [Chloroflexota bacterium]|nr:cytochrome ubiquinol oxidase subunit I [Chloroflexota bacterium]
MRDTVPEFNISVPITGNIWIVGIVFLLHITAVAFIIGIAMIAPVAELLGMRTGGERWERLAYQLSTIIERIFAWGATWAAFSLVAIWGLFPRVWGYLSSTFFIQIIIIAGILWFVMSVTAYLYYVTWEPLRQRRWLHNAIGWTFVLFTMVFITVIVMFSSYQLTPTDGEDRMLTAAANPSYGTEAAHRHIGNLSYGGILLAGLLGGWLLLFGGGGEGDRRSFRSWAADAGFSIGAVVLLMMPFSGWFYANQIRLGSPGAFALMMLGDNGWMFRIQIGLLGTTFLLSNLYIYLNAPRDRINAGQLSWMRYSLWVNALLIGLAVLPKDVPLGQMRPWKYIALAGYILLLLINLITYLRARSGAAWVASGRRSYAVLAALGVVVVALFVMMGIIRTSARGNWLIYERMPVDQGQELVRP